jgi:hypothetical protein
VSNSNNISLKIIVPASCGLAYLFILFIYGAVPGLVAPTSGQAMWALGFARSMADYFSVIAHNIGYPLGGRISFGLPAVLTMAALLKAGLNDADTYAAAFAIWLAIAFLGAYSFCRLFDVDKLLSVVLSALWMSTPFIWAHNGYSMLVLGFAMLPAYVCWSRVAWCDSFSWAGVARLFVSAVVAIFMDGYSLMCFAAAVGMLWLADLIYRRDVKLQGLRFVLLAMAFSTAGGLYLLYVGKELKTYQLDFFRAFGANIEFWFVPTSGRLLLFDALGLSVPRLAADYFGNDSVVSYSFLLISILLCCWAILSAAGNRMVWVFVLIAVVGFYFAMGPSVKWFVTKPAGMSPMMPSEFGGLPTGSGWLSENLPGFSTMRASYRWGLLAAFGMWGAIVAASSWRENLNSVTIVLASIGIIFSVPNEAIVGSYFASRQHLIDAEAYSKQVGSVFKPNERVFFAPWNNDFFATYLAPRVGIRTFNIGGDKNLTSARKYWPQELLDVGQGRMPGANFVSAILQNAEVDAIALSFINNKDPVFGWPVAEVYKDEASALADELEQDSRFSIDRSAHYIVIRLK